MRIVEGSMGSFLCPPGHACHKWHLEDGSGSMSLEYAAKSTEEYLSARLKKKAMALIAENPGEFTEEWQRDVYRHFRYCYSPDGVNRSASDCIVVGSKFFGTETTPKPPPTWHLGFLMCKQYDPAHQPRLDLM